MPFDNGRFTLLAVLAYLAAQSLSPFRGGGVRAVAVHHQFKATQRNQFARHKTEEMADYDTVSLLHNQALFSLPWSGKGDRPSKQVVSFSVFIQMSRTWLTYVLTGESSSNSFLNLFLTPVLQTRSGKKRSIATSNAHVAKHTDNHRRQAPPQWIRTPRNGTLFNNTVSTSSSPDGMPGIVAIFVSWSTSQVFGCSFRFRRATTRFLRTSSLSSNKTVHQYLTPQKRMQRKLPLCPSPRPPLQTRLLAKPTPITR